jgi:hypothetical protein
MINNQHLNKNNNNYQQLKLLKNNIYNKIVKILNKITQ